MQIKTVFCSVLLFLLCGTSLAVAVDNSAIGTLKLVDLNISNYNSIPNGVYLASKSGVLNSTVVLNSTLRSVDYSKNSTDTGEMYISKLYPMTDGNIAIDFSFDRDNSNSELYIISPVSYVKIVRGATGNVKVTSIYTNSTGASIETSNFLVPATSAPDGRVKIHVTSYSNNKTNVVWFNDTLNCITPYRSVQSRDLPYPVLITPLLYIESYVPSGNITCHLFGVEQTIPQYTITPYSDKNYTSFGLDYPSSSTTGKGTAYMKTNAQKGTVWVDVDYPKDVTYIKSLLSDGWELGIHFNTTLTSHSLIDSYAIIDSETATITALYGQSPTSWCSLKNSDNISHAIYCYKKHNMLWRNGMSGCGYVTNVGNVCNYTIAWWNTSGANEVIHPVFTHRLDITPAIAYSLDAEKFFSFSDLYKSKGIDFVGYNEYYSRGIVQTSTVNVIESTSSKTTFTVVTPGEFPCKTNVNLPDGATYVYHGYTPVVSTSKFGGVEFTATPNLEYTVSSVALVEPNSSLYSGVDDSKSGNITIWDRLINFIHNF